MVILHLQYSTQWDSLAHVGQMFDADGDGMPEPVLLQRLPRRRAHRRARPIPTTPARSAHVPAKTTSRCTALGVENMAVNCVQGRGVMIDLHAHVGRARVAVGYDQLMRIMETDNVVVEPGDMVCLHTGFAQMLLEMNKQPDPHVLENACAALDGRDAKLLQWITDSGLVVADRRQLRGGSASGDQPAGHCAVAAAARALPVQARRPPRRDLAT